MHGALAAISSKLSALQAIQALGLTTGLQLCLDAGDENSYSSGQVWNDRSGNSYHFNLGATSGAEASDPTFNGTVGQLSSNQYWSFDGGDYFTLGQANPTWVNNIHKNNAKWVICGWLRIANVGVANDLIGNCDGDADFIGFSIFVRSTAALRLGVAKAAGGSTLALLLTSTATVTQNAWTFFAVQIDEAAATGLLQLNATQEPQVTTYSSPSAAASTFTLQVAGAGNGTSGFGMPPSNGSRMAMVVAWEGTIPTAANLLSFYNLTRGRFGV